LQNFLSHSCPAGKPSRAPERSSASRPHGANRKDCRRAQVSNQCSEQSKSCGLVPAWAPAEAGNETATRAVPELTAHRSLPGEGAGSRMPQLPGPAEEPPSALPEAAAEEQSGDTVVLSAVAPSEVSPSGLMSTALAISPALQKLGAQRMGLRNVMKMKPSHREANPVLKITKHQQSTGLSA